MTTVSLQVWTPEGSVEILQERGSYWNCKGTACEPLSALAVSGGGLKMVESPMSPFSGQPGT